MGCRAYPPTTLTPSRHINVLRDERPPLPPPPLYLTETIRGLKEGRREGGGIEEWVNSTEQKTTRKLLKSLAYSKT